MFLKGCVIEVCSLWTTSHQYRSDITIITIFNKRPAGSLITRHQITCIRYWICHIVYYSQNSADTKDQVKHVHKIHLIHL